ncbi:MAG TPA: hypothetical protein VK435_02855, partial [Thermodesulfovibrionales bacterium]|nr:hypothetical protein [Thermodesulfovibrionales bacterium]
SGSAGGGSSSGGGSGSGSGSGTTINAANELNTTCLTCHGDNRSRVSCSNSRWTAHNGTRVSTAVYNAVSTYLTGSTCSTSGGSTGSGSGSSGGDD